MNLADREFEVAVAVIEEGLRTALRDPHDQFKLGLQSVEECMNRGPGI